MDKHDLDFYQGLRIRINEFAESKEGLACEWTNYLLAAPDLFHLLCKLVGDKDVSISSKALLGMAIAYFISPADLIPEAILGPIGFVDDIAVAAFVLNKIINKGNPEIVVKHWAGEQDVLVLIQKIIAVADDMIGGGLWEKIKKSF